MAEPLDSALILDDVNTIVQQQYYSEYLEQWVSRFGKTTNKIFKPSDQPVVGDGLNFQYELGPAHSARASTSILGDFTSPQQFQPGSLKVRFSQTGACDFVRVSSSAQVNDIDMANAGKGTIVDLVKRIVASIMPDYDEHLAQLRNLPKTGLICSVSATPKKNDARALAACTATASNTAGLRFGISGASRAYFRPGMRLDFVVGGVVVAGNIQVTDVNLADPTASNSTIGGSVGCAYISTGVAGQLSTGNLANVTSAATVYYAGEQNAGMYSMGAFFSTPSAGESFIGGVDRTTSSYRFLVPTTTREYDTSAAITTNVTVNQSHFTDLANAMNYTDESEFGGVFVAAPEVVRKLQNDIFQSSIIQMPIGDNRSDRWGHFGMSGVFFQDPSFGTTQIIADPLINPNRIRFIRPDTWLALSYGWKGLRMMPGDNGKGGWYRMNAASPNTGKSIFYKSDWYALHCDICTKPWKNGEIRAIQAG